MAALAATAAAPQDQDPAAAVVRLEHAVSDSSVAGGFAAALGSVLDSGAAYLHPGVNAAVGALQVTALLHALPAVDSLVVEWRTLHVALASDTSLALTWGVATARPRASPGGVTRFGRYIAAWRRVRGRWKLAAFATSQLFPAAVLPATGLAPAPADTSGPFAAADRAFAEWAGRLGAGSAFGHFAAEDAVVFGGNGLLLRGPAAIRASFAGDHAAWRWRPVVEVASRSGDIGFTVGESAITAGAETFYGKYLTLWRREGDGPRFIADIGNARPAPEVNRR